MKSTFAVLAALANLAAPAYAADPQIVITTNNSRAAHARIVEAAETVCRTALRHDPFGDFGSFAECVTNSVAGAHPIDRAYSAQDIASSTRRN